MRYLILLLFLAVFSGCQSPGKETKKKEAPEQIVVDFDLDKIIDRGYLIAIIDNSSTGLFLYRGRTLGYEYELLEMFTDSIGVGLRMEIVANLEKAFEMLDRGEGDIMAYNLTVTKERQKRIKFSHYHNLTHLVLIQKKPDGWRQMKLHEIEREMTRNLVDLIGQEVHVRYNSSYVERLNNLSEEIGGDIIIVEDNPDLETEHLIRKVSEGEIKFTVAEENVAAVNAAYYPILDIDTEVSFPQQIAWGVRKNADSLLTVLNEWIVEMRKTPEYYVVYDKYFKNVRSRKAQVKSEYSSLGGGNLSPYDNLIKKAARDAKWDWRLLAAQMFQESKFDPKAESWAGAVGLMQVLPGNAKEMGYDNVMKPENNINAGIALIQWLQDYWEEKVDDPIEKLKFVLASYNVGQGHVMDAIRLAEKYDDRPANWEVVSEYLIKKSSPRYFNDPVVQFGYCRGHEPVNYVNEILATYENYKKVFQAEENKSDSVDILSF